MCLCAPGASQGRTLGECGRGVTPPPSLAENCKKSVQNSFKIVENIGPISQSRDVGCHLYLIYFSIHYSISILEDKNRKYY